MKQGEIYLADLGPIRGSEQAGRRPVEGGLARDSVLLCHQIRVLDRNRLIARLGQVSNSTLAEVERVAAFTFGMQIPTQHG